MFNVQRVDIEVRVLSRFTFIVLCFLLGFPTTLAAEQFTDPFDGAFDVSEYLRENTFGFLPVPVIITEPAVDNGVGMMGLFFHESEEEAARRKALLKESPDAAKLLLPPSLSIVGGAITGNNSWFAGGGHVGFFNEGAQRYLGFAGYGDVKLDYYSVGDIELERPFSLKTQGLAVINSFKWKLGEIPLFIGPKQRYVDAQLQPANLEGYLRPDTPSDIADSIADLLSVDTTLSSIGVDVEWDSRDKLFTPTSGLHVAGSALFNRDFLGSDIKFDGYTLDAEYYYPLTERWRLGVRGAGEMVESDATLPPYARPSLQLRGVPAARYQGDRIASLETEVTWQVTDRWSLLGFVGGGRAWADSDSFSDASTVAARGAGVRYKIARSYGLHVGVDVARGPEDTVFYIQVGSAW